MHVYAKICAYAASAGSLEGYVYRRGELDIKALGNWVGNLSAAYGHLPPEVCNEIQPVIDETLGRALRSLTPVLGEGHETVMQLASMVKGPIPESADDFQKTKWFHGRGM